MSDKEMDKFYDEMEGKTIFELTTAMNQLRIELDAASAVKTLLQKKYDALRLNLVPPAMDDNNVTTMSVDGVGRVGLTADVYVSVLAENRLALHKWLRDNNHADLIKETVNAGTLKAFIKASIKKGETFPEDIIKVTPFSRVTIAKK